ncbi:glycosyltransferase family 2 protein [Nocardioides sp.]|uniref:glycosyltransferase n=1 Tax=Nocardioides sp. TaxID=35761 RepID=UPI0027202D94|nr:glycosyltransferase family 2 protein [Nocardioides sp.]MDO9457931.1 glycosyltransferase family 2 protein [Nocardioides sp.]
MPDVADAVADALATLLDGARLPALVLSDVELQHTPDETTVVEVADDKPEGHFRTVVLVATDVDDLRRQVLRVGATGWARVVGVVLADHDRVLTLRPDPAWPPPAVVEAQVGWTRIEFAERLEVLPVLRALARGAAPAAWGHGGLRVAREREPFDDPATKHPPDVVVEPPTPPVVSEATGRAPVSVLLADRPETVDEGVYNPIGFRREWTRPVVDLDPHSPISPSLVRDLRDAQGVRLAPGHDHSLVAGLAMSGIPLLVADPPAWLPVTDDEVSLDDALRREELSVRQRRAALTDHSLVAGRVGLATTARVRPVGFPSVSILLPTRRPDLLAHALVQVTRQRRTLPGAEVELVLAAHGFTPDPDLVDAASELGGVATSIVTATTDISFGELLRLATDAAQGDVVLKMDDDDWYGPDVVTDLLLARHYSGAEVVGMPAELVHLEEVDATVRRRGPSENYGSVVAGGTMMLDRTLLRELGGWRPAPRFVDAHVLDQVLRAGGRVYRTHGLGYVLRRQASGHTWDPGLDYFLRPESLLARWDGFRPSALMDL